MRRNTSCHKCGRNTTTKYTIASNQAQNLPSHRVVRSCPRWLPYLPNTDATRILSRATKSREGNSNVFSALLFLLINAENTQLVCGNSDFTAVNATQIDDSGRGNELNAMPFHVWHPIVNVISRLHSKSPDLMPCCWIGTITVR